ncbi:MAG: SDR family oxidoreductase [Candidatus Krumholzibacteria bacterium]|nr:SDR family oxidoreductase [Candidatus Krumholzibacteria bacterium]
MQPTSRHVVVSGGSKGLGKAIVLSLLAQGYCVSTFSRTPTCFVEEMAEKHGDQFHFAVGDVSNPEQLAGVVKSARMALGPPYGLINNAGIALDGVLATAHYSEIEQTLAVNLLGALALTREILRALLLGRGGRIINISSVIGLRGYSGLSVYATTKAGIHGMTRALARELGERGITVNAIAPGYLETEMTHGLTETQRNQIARRTPIGRLGTPEDVLGLVLFLLSEPARFITGQVIAVDGGVTC